MKAITQTRNDFFKFNANGIEGGEKIKNDTHLWCDYKHNIYQILGNVRDMNDEYIPKTFYVRGIGVWFEKK